MSGSRQPTSATVVDDRSSLSSSRRGRQLLALAAQRASRRPALVLLAVLPLMLAIPLIGPSINPNLSGDEPGYLRLAENLVHGHYLTGRDDAVTGGPGYPNLWFGPGLPLVLTPFVALHVPVTLIRLLGPLFVFASVLVFFQLLRLHVSQTVALAGSLAFGLYLPFYTVLEHLHSETLSLLLIVTLMYGTSKYLRAGAVRHLVLAGIALGWLALTRVAFGWVLIAMLVFSLLWWGIRRGASARRFAAVCTLALAVTVPWLAYTYSVTHRPLYWGSSGGLSLYWASTPYDGELGDWHQAREVFADPQLSRHRDFFRSLIGRPLVEQDQAFMRAGIDNIRARPAKYAKNVLANVSRMWFDFPYSFREERVASLLFVVPNALVLSALLGSLTLLIGRWRRVLPVEAIPFALFGMTTFTLHALLAAYPRMLFAVIPVVIWLAILVLGRCVRVVPRQSGG
jgi:hypothetical protein